MGKKKDSSPPPPYTVSQSNGYRNQLNDEDDSASYQIDDDEANVVTDEPRKSEKLSWVTKLAYASAGLPYSMQLSIIAFYINYFLLDVAKVAPNYNAVILFLSRLIDGLTDPIGGYLFSRMSFRWGKMKPWILFGSPLVALCYFAVWCLPPISEGGQLVYYLFAHSLLWTFMTAVRIPHTALTVYMTMDQNERDQLTKYRTLMEAAGLLLSIVFHWGVTTAFNATSITDCDNGTSTTVPPNASLPENFTSYTPILETTTVVAIVGVPANVAGAYMTSAGVVSLICIATSIFLFYNVREIVDVIPTSKTSFLKGCKMIIRYKPFVILTVATVASILATQSIQSVLELYLTHVRKQKGHFIFLAATLIISTMVLLFVWAIVMRKIGKKSSFLIGNLCLIPTIIIVLISDSPIVLLYLAAIMGANTVACGYVMPWAMLPECIDAFMLETGRRPVEIFYTFFFLGAKLVQALYAGLVQLSLGASGFDAKLCDQPAAVSLTLKLLMGAVPGVVLVVSTICLWFYSIDDKRAKEIQIQLTELRNSSSQTKQLQDDSMDNDSLSDQTSF